MFTQVAQMVAVPCTVAGTNALTLTPIGAAPSFTSYQNFTAARFVAGATTTGAMTAQFGALGSLNVYLADGITQAAAGAVLINQEYVLVFVQALNAGAGGFILESAGESAGVSVFAPNIQVFTSGTALTYTTPTAAARLPLYLRVRMVGGGGGGGAASTNNGTSGANTSFAGWAAVGGSFGTPGGVSGAGGTGGANGTGTLVRRIAGNPGGPGSGTGAGSNVSGPGGAGPWGGAGAGVIGGFAGGAAAANSGSGGGGGNQAASTNTGGGGGSGEHVEFIITTPVASYTYTVGANGVGGAAGGFAGGNGAAGRIEVEAFWQ